jgi:hypothetical protein
MKRTILFLSLSLSATVLLAQTATGGDPGFLKRNFTPVSYLKASNPRPDAKLGFGSALTGRTLVISRDGNTIAVAAPDETSAAKGVNGDQKRRQRRRIGRGLRLHPPWRRETVGATGVSEGVQHRRLRQFRFLARHQRER